MDSRDLREKYFNLEPQQLMIIAVILLILEAGLSYMFVMKPVMTARKQLAMENKTSKEKLQLIEMKLAGRQADPEIRNVVDPESLTLIDQNSNKLIDSEKLDGFIKLLEDVTGKSGGKNVEILEGMTDVAYLKIGKTKEIYKVKKLPLSLSFDSSYAAASNFLFQLKSMNHLMVITAINISNEDYRGDIQVSVSLDLYYTDTPEETPAPGES